MLSFVLLVLLQLRVAKVTGGAANKLSKIKSVRKGVARVLTVYNQKQRVRYSFNVFSRWVLPSITVFLCCYRMKSVAS